MADNPPPEGPARNNEVPAVAEVNREALLNRAILAAAEVNPGDFIDRVSGVLSASEDYPRDFLDGVAERIVTSVMESTRMKQRFMKNPSNLLMADFNRNVMLEGEAFAACLVDLDLAHWLEFMTELRDCVLKRSWELWRGIMTEIVDVVDGEGGNDGEDGENEQDGEDGQDRQADGGETASEMSSAETN